MKIQETTIKPSTSIHHQQSNSGSNFKQKIPTYINEINLSNSLLDQQEQPSAFTKLPKKIHLQAQKNDLRSEVSTILQTSDKLYLFLGRTMMQNYSEVIVYQYLKINGSNNSMEMNGIKGEITCMKAKFCKKRKKILGQKSETIRNTKKSSSLKNNPQNHYEVVLLIGTNKGYLKTLRFGDIHPTEQRPVQPSSIKLDFTQIVDLIPLEPDYYNGANISLVLSYTNRVYLVNFDSMQVVSMFFPSIMSCEVGLSLSVNYYQQYFVQSCEGGYVVFWELNEKILGLIDKSSQHKSQTTSSTQAFHSQSISHNISPLSIFHSATISGLKFCQLYGNLLLIITQRGLLKLLAINNSSHFHVNQNEYCSLMQYQIQDGQLVSDVKFYVETMEVFVVKSVMFEGINGRSGVEKYLPVKEYNAERDALRKKYEKEEGTRPYKPKTLRNIKNNILPQSKLFPHKKVTQHRCSFQRIVFSPQLQISKVDKIYPSKVIECIESLEMTQSKDIIVLRGRDYYLIGVADMFNVVEVN